VPPPSKKATQTNHKSNHQSTWSIPKIPIGLGLLVIAAVQLKHVHDRHDGIIEVAPGVVISGPWFVRVCTFHYNSFV
jgi:hypothetical protein